MMLLRGLSAANFPVAIAILICASGAPPARNLDVPVIATAAPAFDPLAGLRGGERFPQGAQLLLVTAGHAEPLVDGFAASADANVSFDGKKVLFAGRKNPSDHWAIWELTLADRSVRKVIGGDTDLIRPLYLPAMSLVYARRAAHGFHLESAQLDGTGILQLTHAPSSALPVDVLADGRILFESSYPLGSASTSELYLVYSDGSGVESYRCDHGSPRWGGKQLASGDVVFTHGPTLARFTSPLATEARVLAPRADYSGSIAETPGGAWLASARTATGSHYALAIWKPGEPALQKVFSRNGEDIVDPVIVAPHHRPNHHPSGLHDWDYANLLCLDARESRQGVLKSAPAQVRLDTLDASGKELSLGRAPVEPDGSFFVKIPGDKPIRIALLDSHGAVLRQENGWFWSRRGEQRICVGCHTGPERASENRVPAVLLRTTTPADLTGKPALPLAESH
jgi:hypothetical protein